MCLVLYIGLDKESSLIPPQDFSTVDSEDPTWPSKVVPFSVEEIVGDKTSVKKHFTTPIVRYAGSFEGCGCGYNACHINEWEEPTEPDLHELAGRESRRLLHAYAQEHDVRQIYACWSGEESLPPTEQIEVELDKLTDWTFEIPQRSMLKLTKS